MQFLQGVHVIGEIENTSALGADGESHCECKSRITYMATRNERDRRRVADNRERLNEYKLSRGCVDCGYKENVFALEFDHRENSGLPYTGKSRTIASGLNLSWGTILKKIERCDVVCSNCHSIRTLTRLYTGNLGEPG